jgi:uncharacterized membrane protein
VSAPPSPAWLTPALVAACVMLFAVSVWSAWVLAGRRSALGLAGLALVLGWLAEQMGSSRGWFFGRYHYTTVLGPEIGNVPVAIALMWFALCWIGYAIACLILWRSPTLPAPGGWWARGLTAWLAAMIVTAFDLGADPYFVFVLKAWIMQKTDGGWFGETLQGFVGWMTVSFAIVLLFQALFQPREPAGPDRGGTWAALAPLLVYGSGLGFQLLFGHPVETRAVAFFAMGLPVFVALVAWWQWTHPGKDVPA